MLLTSITINNTNAGPGVLGSVYSSVKDWVVAHPYLTYALIGAVVGTAVYFYGRPRLGRSKERAMSDPASTARVIQSNTNLRNEMERTRPALNEVRDSLVDIQLELARGNANALIELSQQGQATNAVVRETAALLNTVNTNLVAVHETAVQLVAATGCLISNMNYLSMETVQLAGQTALLAPEIFLAASLCGLWVLSSGRFTSRIHDYMGLTVALTAVAVAYTLLWLTYNQNEAVLLHDLVVVNFYTQAVKLFCLVGVLPIVMGYVQSHGKAPVQSQLLMLTAVFFMLALVSSNSLLTAYVNIEGLSIMLYVLAGAARSHGSSEAGLKYYGAGAAISAVLMLGLALSYQGAKSFELAAIASVLWNGGESLALVVGLRLVALALFMKLAAVPGHVWAPDVYEGVELPVTAFFATVSKLMVFALVARLVYGCLGLASGVFRGHNTIIMSILAAASIAVGCFGALGQITFKRFIAYAAINQIGFLLIGLAVQSDAGIQRTLHYLVVYMVASLALFAGLFTLEAYGQKANYLSDLSAAFHNGGVGAVLLVFVAVLSMAGLPPFAGFFGKYALWVALIDGLQTAVTTGESVALSALMAVSVVTSVFSMYYYLRVLKIAVFDRTGDEGVIVAPLSLTLSTSGIVVGSVLVVWGFVLFLALDLSAIGLILDGALISG